MIYILKELKYRPKSREIECYLLRKSSAILQWWGWGGRGGCGGRGLGGGKKHVPCTCSGLRSHSEIPFGRRCCNECELLDGRKLFHFSVFPTRAFYGAWWTVSDQQQMQIFNDRTLKVPSSSCFALKLVVFKVFNLLPVLTLQKSKFM